MDDFYYSPILGNLQMNPNDEKITPKMLVLNPKYMGLMVIYR